MKSKFIPIFKLPTTIVLVDDDKQFLQNFSYKLGQKHPVKSFFETAKALEYLNTQKCLGEVVAKIFRKVDAFEMDDDSAYMVFAYENLTDILYNAGRFSSISVLLIDYLMPKQMTGIEFCEKIRTLPLRKIMLTGKADNGTAVDAFNRNIINKFICKDPKNIMEQVHIAIEEETDRYFEDISSLVSDWKLRQRNIAAQYDTIFFETIKKYSIVEYYQIGDSAYVMLDKDANIYWLILQNQEKIHEHCLLGKDNHASTKVMKKLKDKSHLLFLFSEEEKKLTVENWEQFTFPILGKTGEYFYTIIPQRSFSLEQNKIRSYSDYVKSVEAEEDI